MFSGMSLKHILIFFLPLYLSTLLSCKNKEVAANDTENKKSLFTLLTPGQTNIKFENTLTEAINTNVLIYQ